MLKTNSFRRKGKNNDVNRFQRNHEFLYEEQTFFTLKNVNKPILM